MNAPAINLPPPMVVPLRSVSAEPLPLDDSFEDLIAVRAPEAVRQATQELISPSEFLRFHGLRENPFADGIQPRFFFRTEGHSEAFRSMMLAVEFEASLGMVTGPSGTGKTLVGQLILEHLSKHRHQPVLVLATPGLGRTGLLREIAAELNLALPAGIARVQDLMQTLSEHIIDLQQSGRRLVVLIDEAHLLSAECLHVVRTLSNIETPERKLVTCLLFAEARFGQRLAHPSYDALRNRIYLRAELQPLSAVESAQFIKFRLMTAGRLHELFTPGALAALHEAAGGISRSLNKLAMLSLVEAARGGRQMIDDTIVNNCATRA